MAFVQRSQLGSVNKSHLATGINRWFSPRSHFTQPLLGLDQIFPDIEHH